MYTEKVSNQEKFNSHKRMSASFVDDARHVYRVVTTKITVDGESKTKEEKFVLCLASSSREGDVLGIY